MEVKKTERDFHNLEGYDYDLLWVKKPRFEYHYKRIVSYVKKFFGKNQIMIIDIGCGTGRCSLFLLDSPNIVVGLDISRELLKIFKEKIENSDSRFRTELILCDAEMLPLKNGIADLVTFWGTLHHLPNKLKALIEGAALLKNGRFLVLHEPNAEGSRIPWGFAKLLNWIPLRVVKKYRKENQQRGITQHEKPIAIDELELIVRKCNLEIIEKRTVWFFGFVPVEFPEKLCRVYYFLMNKFDLLIERYSEKGGGALFIIARNTDLTTK